MKLKKGLFILFSFIISVEVEGARRLIVKFKKGHYNAQRKAKFGLFNRTGNDSHQERMILEAVNDEEFAELKNKFNSDPDVAFVEEDRIFKHSYEPGDGGTTEDQSYSQQWHYFENFGLNLPAAWDVTLGSASTIVAVLDTGITSHPDLNSKIVGGADLINDPNFSNDGGGRDTDPNDPGDYIAWGDQCYRGWPVNSSWHGTHVAGTIAASTGNGVGVAGVNWNAKIQPVRVLGKCGGYESDIADGIRWAVGLQVSGLPVNSNPAKVINMSLGGQGPCSFTMQNAIDQANSRGATIVVAAGNDNTNMDFSSYSPANCNGVLVVGATSRSGSRAYYSNYGNKVDVSGPGGDDSGGILSTHNSGTQSPGSASYTYMNGTSMATPHVAGIISLMLAVQPGLYPGQIRDIVRNTAQSFPWNSNCDSSSCGSGIADAYQAVLEAQITTPDPNHVPSDPSNGGTSGTAPIYTIQEDDGGAGCGTIDTSGSGTGPGGGNKMFSYLLMMLAGTIMVHMKSRIVRTK